MSEAQGAPSATPHVVVVGGGITGLAAGHRLLPAARDGKVRVTLIEATGRLGGKVQTAHLDGNLLVEEGPDSFLARKTWAKDLCEALGLGADLVATPTAHRRSFIYHDGHLHPLPAGTLNGVPSRLGPFLRSRLITPKGKMRALMDIALPRVLGPTSPDIALGRFLRARLGHEALERLAEPLLSGIYAGGSDGLSLDATFPQLRRQEREHRSLILAAVDGARRARRAAAAAAAAGDAPAAPPPMFLTLRAGLGELVAALERALTAAPGVELRRQSAVRCVERSGRGGYTVRLADEEMHADAVVVTAPAPAAATIVRTVAPTAARELETVAYADVALVAMAFERTAVGHPLVGSGFVVPGGEDIGITACTWVSAKWPETAPADTVLLRAYLGHSASRILERSDADLVSTARDALKRAMAIEAAPRLVHVIRTPQGLPQYAVGHLARLERIEAALANLPGLRVTGAAFRGVGLPDCVRQGQEAADAALTWAASATVS